MSVTTFISEENITMIQGVNGIFLHQERWLTPKQDDKPKERGRKSDSPSKP